MPAAIERLTVSQFVSLLASSASELTRKIDAVHLHHTWRPTRSQFKGLATIEAMRNYHVNTKGWRDIAQHLTIDPHGFLWTGRNWNLPPASQAGRNGTSKIGPFMIEIVGDFDLGRDVLDGEQRSAVVSVTAALLSTFGLDTAAVLFHRELGSPKSCPGTGVDKAKLLKEIEESASAVPREAKRRGARTAKTASSATPFPARFLLGYEVTAPVDELEPGFENHAAPEDEYAVELLREETRARVLAGTEVDARDFTTALQRSHKWDMLRPYVINLTKGRLSQSGEFSMPDGSIEAILDSIKQFASVTEQPRIMLHAHGGLVGEKTALTYARDAHQWWLNHGVYPIYFVWETSLFEVFKQKIGLARGLGDARDFLFEATARAAGGKAVWSAMKESARLASSVNAGQGEAGGARIFIEALANVISSASNGQKIEVHAVGHSAGAIFHSHMLPLLLGLGVSVESLSLLAPAVRVDLFKQMLLGPITAKKIGSFTMFTMDEEAERDDDCVEPLGATLYGKSLLYLVSRAFEPKRKTPILGLEEMVRDDNELMKLFEGTARLELARARGKPQNDATQAKQHGAFDNDPATMASVLKIIAGVEPGTPFPVASERAFSIDRVASALDVQGHAFGLSIGGDRGGSKRLRALCVGIDEYRDNALEGCVRDAKTWARALSDLRFDVKTLLNGAATRDAVLAALKQLIESARPGDHLVFQYSGHGTQVEDLNGDESDRYDEALVPVDYHTGALLLDDDLADVYRSVPDGVVLTLFMDCCHSGTNSRFAPIDRGQARGSEKRRFLELPPDVKEAHLRFRARAGSPAPTSAEESLPGVIHYAACLDNQFAYESNGQGHFTQAVTARLIEAVSQRVTNESFATEIATEVGGLGRPQTPRLMRLPAELAGRPIFSAAAESATATGSRVDLEWERQCLQFFEVGAAYLRERLGN
jgi:hypothetical protein